MTDLAHMHESYERSRLQETNAAADPLEQFGRWLAEALASDAREPNAMTLSTVGANGRPSSRVVLIKHCDERGIVWYTNYNSRKGRELAHCPFAALQFFWPELQRVVRVEGRVAKVSSKESDAYYASRPLGSRISAWASAQSRVVASRAALEAEAERYRALYPTEPPRPPHWGGFRLAPDTWEFWQGRKDRLHDRLRYRLAQGQWVRERLAP